MIAQARNLIRTRVGFLKVGAAKGRRCAWQAKCQGTLAHVGRYSPRPEENDQGDDYGQPDRERERNRDSS